MPSRRAPEYGWWERHGRRLPAKGIKAQTQRGAFGKTWWASRWIAALERLVDPARLARGRSYARSGQVVKLDVGRGGVSAAVQGSRPTPYKVAIRFEPLSDPAWEKVIDGMAAEALYAARLLSEEMPEQIEEVFTASGSTLFPSAKGDMVTDCSCPDYANPCKHVAAVHYLLGERFDVDPFLMFELRGRDKAEILEALRARRSGGAAAPEETAEGESEPAPNLVEFWVAGADGEEVALKFALPEVDALAVKRLGPPTFVRDQQAFVGELEQVYREISRHALLLAIEDATGVSSPD